MSNASTLRQRAQRAAKYIQKHGWTTGVMEDEQGAVCLLGAIKKVTRGSKSFETTQNYITKFVPSRFFGSIVSYNDARGRTKKQVLDILEKAASADGVQESYIEEEIRLRRG